ncbi:MAG: hypothetical protein JWR69_3016 [Pedosphaera sp.]|nr:hypothetical protein [Pedosphaera sp.]
MVEGGRYCVDILTQIAAARSALDALGVELSLKFGYDRSMKFRHLLVFAGAFWACTTIQAVSVSGQIRESASSYAIPGARVTLFSADLRFFREQRSDAVGNFQIGYIGEGTYRLGVAALGYEYQERTVTVSNTPVTLSFNLVAETNGGRWTIVGNTEPELLDGTGSGSLLPTGEVLFCHDTEEPIVFDPVAALKWYPPDSGSAQGCHMVTLNTSGALMFCGGSMGGNPLDPVVKTVKTFWRSTNAWVRMADMNVARWYAGLVRLPDQRIMVMGGELDNPSYGRTNGCEIWNPSSNTWTLTGSFNLPTEIAPAVVLYTGEVLKTWRYPEIYNISNGTWRAAANMIQTRNGAAGGDHCDHEIVHLPDGRVMAVGIFPTATNASTRFVEFYSPSNNTWSLGPNPRALRHRPEALILPDGRVLSFGGQYSGPSPAPVPTANAGTIPDCTRVADLYDVTSNTWRAMADMNRFIHYHNVTVLVPDGRVMATGGAGLTSNRSFAGDDSSIEAFEPPYLFRGVRPRIDSLSTTEMVLGSNFTFKVSFASAITRLVLVSARATSHWVDGGPQRFLSLDFSQNGSDVQAAIPSDPVKALAGYYNLFAMVDDVPSVGKIVRITPTPAPRPGLPSVTVVATDATASFGITRTGVTTAPMRVNFAVSGSAVNGADYNTLSNFVVIPAGAASATVLAAPKDDAAVEGSETASISLASTAAYDAGPGTNATITLLDNEAVPPPTGLQLAKPFSGQFEVTLTGAATRLYALEISTNLLAWQPLTTLVNDTGIVRLTELSETNRPNLFFRARLGP